MVSAIIFSSLENRLPLGLALYFNCNFVKKIISSGNFSIVERNALFIEIFFAARNCGLLFLHFCLSFSNCNCSLYIDLFELLLPGRVFRFEPEIKNIVSKK